MTTENLQLDNNEEIPPPAYQPTWDDIRKQRNDMLLHAELEYNFDSPDEIINAWQAYKQELRDIPETYKDLEDLSQIGWPPKPNFEQQLMLSRLTR